MPISHQLDFSGTRYPIPDLCTSKYTTNLNILLSQKKNLDKYSLLKNNWIFKSSPKRSISWL